MDTTVSNVQITFENKAAKFCSRILIFFTFSGSNDQIIINTTQVILSSIFRAKLRFSDMIFFIIFTIQTVGLGHREKSQHI